MFKPLEGETVVIKTCAASSVVYSQHDLAVYNSFIFAKIGSTYIMLYEDHRTSHVKKTWESLTLDAPHYKFVKFGKMQYI